MQIDIRSEGNEEITEIVFSETDNTAGDTLAYRLIYATGYNELGGCLIEDVAEGQVFICNKEHALNLIKALNKAIELGWFE